jgi:hypothetical protein
MTHSSSAVCVAVHHEFWQTAHFWFDGPARQETKKRMGGKVEEMGKARAATNRTKHLLVRWDNRDG